MVQKHNMSQQVFHFLDSINSNYKKYKFIHCYCIYEQPATPTLASMLLATGLTYSPLAFLWQPALSAWVATRITVGRASS